MTEHEPLCPWNGTSITFDGSPIGCQCALIRKVHIQMSEDGWVAPESHEAVVAVAKVRAARGALDDLRGYFESLREDAQSEYDALPRYSVSATIEFTRTSLLHAVIGYIDSVKDRRYS